MREEDQRTVAAMVVALRGVDTTDAMAMFARLSERGLLRGYKITGGLDAASIIAREETEAALKRLGI